MNNHISSKYQISHQNKGYSNKYPLLKETQKILDRAKSEGFALPTDHTIAGMNVLIREKIKNGIWNKLDDFFQYSYNSNPSFKNNTDFTAENWVTVDCSVANIPTIAPDGSSITSKLIASENQTVHYLWNLNNPNPVFQGDTFTYSIYAKAAELSKFQLQIRSSTYPSASFNLSTGTYNLTENSNAENSSAEIKYTGNGWYKCSITHTYTDAPQGNMLLRIYNMDELGNKEYIGNNSDGVYIWGIQFDSGSEAKPFIPDLKNFSRINWKKPESDLATVHGGCTYTAQGWEGNGIDGIMRLNNPNPSNSKFKLNNAGLGGVQYKLSSIQSNSVSKTLAHELNYDLVSIHEQGIIRNRLNQGMTNLRENNSSVGLGELGFKYFRDNTPLYRDYICKTEKFTANIDNDIPTIDNFEMTHFSRVHYDAYSNLGISCYLQGAALNDSEIETFRTLYNNYLEKINLPQIA